MKKLLFLTSSFMLGTAFSSADAVKSGFTGSLAMGYSQTAGKIKSVATYNTNLQGTAPDNVAIVSPEVSANPTSASAGGELTVGYRRVIGSNFVLGVAMGASYSGESASQTFTVEDNGTPPETVRTVNGRLTHGISGLFKVKGGLLLNNVEFYLGAAAVVTPFDFKMTEIPDSDGTDQNTTYNITPNRKSSWGIAPLVGVSYHLNDKMNVFAEFSQTFYRTAVPVVSAGNDGLSPVADPNTNPGYSLIGTSKPVITRALVGIQVTV